MLTKDDLNQISEIVQFGVRDQVRNELKPVWDEVKQVRDEVKQVRIDLRQEFKNQLSLLKAEFRSELDSAKKMLRKEMRAMENRLLGATNRLAEFWETLDPRIKKLEKFPVFPMAV